MAALAPLPEAFDPHAADTTRSLAWLARCAYYDADRLPEALARVDQTLIKLIERRGTTAFVSASVTACVVGFRGTEFNELRDIITDLRVKPVDYAGGRAHSGFVDAMAQITAQLSAALPDRPVWLVGHSLGGALAQIYAARAPRPIVATVSFGSPRVGDAAFGRGLSDLMGERLLRVTHDRDPVLDFPPKPLGYRHCGPELQLLADGGAQRARGIEDDSGPSLAEMANDRARLHLIPHYEAMIDAWMA